jgi:nucleoside-diphosphate-sugar epimerase
MHSVHVDDCAEAYIAVAEYPDRMQVASEIFNISPGQKYETLAGFASDLEKESGFDDAAECEP